jgi:hypothetical protein
MDMPVGESEGPEPGEGEDTAFVTDFMDGEDEDH